MGLFDFFKQKKLVKTRQAELTKLRYDAVYSSSRRASRPISTLNEDRELDSYGRLSLSSQGRDLLRNLTLAGWAIRKHCQFVARNDFKCSIPGQQEYSQAVKKFIYNWGRRKNIDAAQRHNLPQLLRMIETHRIIDGDIGILKLSNGKIQIIEGDRIKTAAVQNEPRYEWVHGVKTGMTGRAFKYAVHRRTVGGGFEFEREVSANDLLLCGYYNRIDQVRGVSLLAPAINQFQDVYEGIEYALARAKVCQLLGLITTTDDSPNLTAAEQEQEAENIKRSIYERWGQGVLHLGLRPGEDAKILNEQTPSTQFQEFIQNVIQIAFASLDIPYSFLDASRQTFYGGRGELDQYIESCKEKQEGLIETLNELTDWRIRMAVMDGELPVPPDGMTVDDVLWYCEWKGARMPLWRMLMDAKEAVVGIQCGLLSPQKLTDLYGMDYDENVQEIHEAIEVGKLYNVPLLFANNEIKQNIGL